LWPADSSDPIGLPPAPGRTAGMVAQDINDDGVIVGHETSAALRRVALWWPARASQPPTILGGGPASALALNRSGTVVGQRFVSALIAVPAGFVSRSVVWDAPAPP
jgi:hypothetical protein